MTEQDVTQQIEEQDRKKFEMVTIEGTAEVDRKWYEKKNFRMYIKTIRLSLRKCNLFKLLIILEK